MPFLSNTAVWGTCWHGSNASCQMQLMSITTDVKIGETSAKSQMSLTLALVSSTFRWKKEAALWKRRGWTAKWAYGCNRSMLWIVISCLRVPRKIELGHVTDLSNFTYVSFTCCWGLLPKSRSCDQESDMHSEHLLLSNAGISGSLDFGHLPHEIMTFLDNCRPPDLPTPWLVQT